MKKAAIEALPQVQQASRVLAELENQGLIEPAIASGWTRGFLTDTTPSDIDISYVGTVPHERAREYLRTILDEVKPAGDWDVNGIWNAQQAYGLRHTVENYLRFYVCSIDTVYLAADGKLHDPTGYGFKDAMGRVLRLNTYDTEDGRMPTPAEDVYVCMEGCRRMAKLGWTPTSGSVERIKNGVRNWDRLSPSEQERQIVKKVIGKYSSKEFNRAKAVYAKYGWGFVFDLAMQAGRA
ncbi:MAG TPA: hypothetical protein VGS28_02370 [Candidatus Saccharimonadales bacterium]|nr:hypothetical protein [Candidatus Saccharimonadales bacterium]